MLGLPERLWKNHSKIIQVHKFPDGLCFGFEATGPIKILSV